MNKKEFFEKLLHSKQKIERRDRLVLICNPYIFKEFDMKQIMNLLEVKKHISISNKEFVCIISIDGYIPPFDFIEEPLEVHFAYNGGLDEDLRYVIMLHWRFTLRIRNKTAIQCVKINYKGDLITE